MAHFAFRVGAAFDWDGAAYKIERLQGEQEVILQRLKDGKFIQSSMDELLKSYAEGRLSGNINTPELQPGLNSQPLACLPEAQHVELKRRMAYLRALSDAGSVVFTSDCLKPIIGDTAVAICDPKPPSVVTVWRWHRRYKAFKDTRALVPRFAARGPRIHSQNERLTALLTDAINESFAASPCATGGMIYAKLAAKVTAENRSRLSAEALTLPSLRTVYRLLQRADAYDNVLLKNGKAEADRRFRISKMGTRTENILERVEADHTPLDLFLIDEKTWLPLGRPMLTVYIDHYSRFPLGYYLSFGGTSATAVVGALRHAILPKQSTVEVIPNLPVRHKWPCYGRPDVLVLDNGLEFLGYDLDSVAMDLFIRLQFCPKRTPRFKGTIERYLKTVNYFFAHQIPGTAMAKMQNRGDYDPQKHAVLTLAEFKHVFEKWLLDIYAQTKHRGMDTTPWAKWHEGLQRRTLELPADLRTLKRRIGLVEERSLRPDGITLNGLRYADESLQPILRKWGVGTKVRMVYDAEDLGEIQVWPPEESDPVVVLAVDQDYARGLTLVQHELIRQQARDNGKAAEDTQALLEARNDVAVALENLVMSRKQRARRKGAKVHGITSENPNARLEPKATPIAKQPARPKSQAAPGADDLLPALLPVFSLKSLGPGHAH